MHVVVEAIFNGRSIAQVSSIDSFHGLAHNMSRAVPEDCLCLRIVELEQLQSAIALEHTIQIPNFAIHLRNDGIIGQTLADATGNLIGCRLPGSGIHLLAIGQCDFDGCARLSCQFGFVLGLAFIPEDITLLDVLWPWIELYGLKIILVI